MWVPLIIVIFLSGAVGVEDACLGNLGRISSLSGGRADLDGAIRI